MLEGYHPVAFAINAIYPHRHYLSAKFRIVLDLLVERFEEYRKWVSPARSE